jgi:PhnB protein
MIEEGHTAGQFTQREGSRTMAKVSTYLNFTDSTEDAFEFYKTVFGTEYVAVPARYGDMPPMEGMPSLPEENKRLILNVQLPILGGNLLMGSDAPADMGFDLKTGNNVQICLHADSREDADRLFGALAEGGAAKTPMADQFWGDYYGELTDKFGILWMVTHTPQS